MNLGEMKAPIGSRKRSKRVGRGNASGQGTYAGKGLKGQKARAGQTLRRGFEGGQMPLQRRLPKRGFTNIHREEPSIVNIETLNMFESGSVITPKILKNQGIVKDIKYGVKVLGDGEINVPLVVKVNQISKSAAAKINACGGQVILVK